VARAICSSLIGTRSSSPIKRSAVAIVGGYPEVVITHSPEAMGGGSRPQVAADQGRVSAMPRRSRPRPPRRRVPLTGDLTPSLGRYALPARALEHREELAIRIAEAGSDLDLHGLRIRPAAGNPTGIHGTSTLRAVCVIPATSVPLPKSPGEIGVYSALGPEVIPANAGFRPGEGSEPKADLERSWTIQAQLRTRS
jgi:hypothetical protein